MIKHRKLLALSVVLLLVGFAPHQGRSPARWAVIVGVNDYMHYGEEAGGDLMGATNDARNIYEVLTARWGFEKENIRMLLDQTATRDSIQRSFTHWLPARVRPGDLVVFYFSGHGSQTWDKNGDESDGLDETICPTDVMRKSSARDIKDDELASWINRLPTKNVTVILDSCHSGTGTRAVAPFVRTRSLSRDPEEDLTAEQPQEVGTRSIVAAPRPAAAGNQSLDNFGEGVLGIFSARSDQVAIESVFDAPGGKLPRAGGAFTTPLVQHLWQVPLTTSYEEVFAKTVQVMKQRNFAQSPEMTKLPGRTQQPIFALPGDAALAAIPEAKIGVAAAAPQRPQGGKVQSSVSGPKPVPATPTPAAAAAAAPVEEEPLSQGAVRVLAVRGNEVELGGGHAAGVTEGSIYRAAGQVLRVSRVESNRAVAQLTDEGTRGIVVGQKPASGPASPAAAAAASVGSVAPGMAAHLVAYRPAPAQLRVTVSDLAEPMRRALAQELRSTPGVVLQPDPRVPADLLVRRTPQGVVVSAIDGEVRHLLPTASASAGSLAPILRKELSALLVARLENPVRPFSLDFAFGGAENRFKIGDELDFRVNVGKDGYLTIVDVDPAGTVAVVFPNQWDENNQVRAGQEIRIPNPSMGSVFRAAEPAGRGIVRVFLTERPLKLPAIAGAITAEQVAAALREAAGPAAVAGSDALPVGSWATTSVVYDIHR